ncbi:hypothetical protein Lalb_Chr21g0315401 [Lupinus albus]|uniref:Uncharacterized protein n=1 Tax=Lupinus albus TaxID=3870 RepID=A0A6A4N7S3_LUPAL|nr:hypothetical protein Lalb_Chr21g0315401 [Lupinus albus]
MVQVVSSYHKLSLCFSHRDGHVTSRHIGWWVLPTAITTMLSPHASHVYVNVLSRGRRRYKVQMTHKVVSKVCVVQVECHSRYL